jgi:cytochrome c peroxidase
MFSRIAARTLRVGAVRAASTLRQQAKAQPLRAAAAGAGLLAGAGGFALVASADASTPDYEQCRRDIADLLDQENWDDGSLGPVFVRLAWHSSGSYDKSGKGGYGGSNGATMRFSPEIDHGGNAGLHLAQRWLEKVKAKHPAISYADLWILAGIVAIEEMGGPSIPFTPGRTDSPSGATPGDDAPTPDGRLPDAALGAQHLRDVFYRMGFNDREIVALSGAHALGRCHTTRSGFDGPWTRAPTTFSNEYFRLLLEEKWTERRWRGPRQFENSASGSDLMMLPTDMALIEDDKFKPFVEMYAKDEELFFSDFKKACTKLFNNGFSWRRYFFGNGF